MKEGVEDFVDERRERNEGPEATGLGGLNQGDDIGIGLRKLFNFCGERTSTTVEEVENANDTTPIQEWASDVILTFDARAGWSREEIQLSVRVRLRHVSTLQNYFMHFSNSIYSADVSIKTRYAKLPPNSLPRKLITIVLLSHSIYSHICSKITFKLTNCFFVYQSKFIEFLSELCVPMI